MGTDTKTFMLSLNSSTTSAAIGEIIHFRNLSFEADEQVAIYLEAIYALFDIRQLVVQKLPVYDGSESDAERVGMFYRAQEQSQKFGLKLLARKNNTGEWKEKAEIVCTNVGRKQNLDLMPLYLSQGAVRLLEKNDAIAVQLVDYGNGLIKAGDKIELEAAIRIEITKKNDDLNALTSRLTALENLLQPFGAATLTAKGTNGLIQGAAEGQQNFLLRGDRTWQNPNIYALKSEVDTTILNLIGAAPGVLNTLDELANALGDDANFATTITNQLASKANNSFSGSIPGEYVATSTTPLNIAANGVFQLPFNNISHASSESVFIFSIYIQYGDGTTTNGHWQMHGCGIISAIQWKAGGSALWTSFNMEHHNGNDFVAQVRFSSSNVNRNLQFSPSIALATQAPSLTRMRLKRIFGPS